MVEGSILSFNSLEDETFAWREGIRVCNSLSIPLRMKHDEVHMYGIRLRLWTFNSLEDETWEADRACPFGHVHLSIPLRMKRQSLANQYFGSYQLSIPLRMKLPQFYRNGEKAVRNFQFPWGWNDWKDYDFSHHERLSLSIPLRMKRKVPQRYWGRAWRNFQFPWGWNPLVQFIMGDDIMLSIPLRMKQSIVYLLFL